MVLHRHVVELGFPAFAETTRPLDCSVEVSLTWTRGPSEGEKDCALWLARRSGLRKSIGKGLFVTKAGAPMGRRNNMLLAGGLLALTLLGVAPVAAGAREDAAAAYGKGDYATALRLFGPLAAQGDAYAETYLGVMDTTGQGVPQNYGQAIERYREAAGQGYAQAQFNLGVMFETGRGVPQSSIEAVRWYRKAADQGHIDAQRRVGVLCPEGTGNQACTALEGKPPSAIPLHRRGDGFLISALINDVLTLDFVIDSGASDVSIPADVVQILMGNGSLRKEDFLGSRIYKLADGSMVPAERFTIRTIKVGDTQIESVTANVGKASGPLLLGQSFLTRFKSWSIDNERGVLLLN